VKLTGLVSHSFIERVVKERGFVRGRLGIDSPLLWGEKARTKRGVLIGRGGSAEESPCLRNRKAHIVFGPPRARRAWRKWEVWEIFIKRSSQEGLTTQAARLTFPFRSDGRGSDLPKKWGIPDYDVGGRRGEGFKT